MLSRLIVVTALLTPCLLAQGLPESNGDPANDTLAGAEAGACNTQHYGSISVAGDNDLWCFSIPFDARVVVWVTSRGSASMTDSIVEIQDSTGAILVSNDDEPAAPGLFSLAAIDLTMAGGPYYANVRGFSSNAGDYALDILCEPSAGALVEAAPESEPNDTCSTGTFANCNENHRNTLQVAGDSDFYCLTLGSTMTVAFETHSDTTTTGTEVGDTKIWLYDSACNEVAQNDDGGAGLYSLLAGQVLSAGTHYLEVSHWQRNGAGDYRLSITCSGGLTVQSVQTVTELTIPPTPLCGGGFVEAAGEAEPNDTCATGTVASCCDSHRNTLQVAGDSDFYCLALGADSSVTFETSDDTTTTGTSVGDTKIWLYDSNCVEITNNDDGGPGLYSRIAEDLSAGTYYLEVSHWQRNGAGDYRLTIDCELPSAGPCVGTSGFPITIEPRVGERPRINSTVTTDIYDAPAGAVVMIGLATTPLVDLSVIGMPGCALGTLVNVTKLPVVPTGVGEGEFGIDLGFFPGLTFFIQVAALDPGANALGVIVSNDRLRWTVGDEAY